MRHINLYSHVPFLSQKFDELVGGDALSKRIWKKVGNYYDGLFDYRDYDEFNHKYYYPVQSLFEWIAKDGGLTFDDISDEHFNVYDDAEELLDVCRMDSVPPVLQMAAFGLWFLDCEMNIMGPASEGDYDENRISPYGWKELNVIEHQAECMLNAYQALTYAERFQKEVILTTEEKSRISNVDFSQLGKKGALKKHASMRKLEAWTIARYREGKWKSANQAAHALMGAVIDHGRTISADLSPSNAQRTIAGWINDWIKKLPS